MSTNRHHVLIAGTGRAGTSFLVEFLDQCGLETGETEWFERARAGGEHYFDPADTALPYVVKDPFLGQYCDRVDLTGITVDALIVPLRDLSSAAQSRLLQERTSLSAADPHFHADSEVAATIPGGALYSLQAVDQERLLAVGFHRLIHWATVNGLPLYLLEFPRLVEDAGYLIDRLSPWLSAHCDGARAHAAFAAVADPDALRVRPGRERLTERPPPPADGEPVANGSGEAAEARRALVWRGEDQLAVDGVEFFVTADSTRYHAATSTPERFVLAKIPPMIERLARVIDELAPQRLAEIGIYKGGSAALLATLARPVRLTAIELQPTPVQALAQFVARRGLQDVVRPHYGVDQADGERLAEILDDDHGDRPLDLVIDDASHLYPETRASFEVLFARLRPGGVYIIEDWAWAHFPGPEWQEGGGPFGDRPALTNLIVELLMLAGRDSELISAIEVMRDTVTVRRGPAVVHGPLRLEAHYVNRGLSFRPLI